MDIMNLFHLMMKSYDMGLFLKEIQAKFQYKEWLPLLEDNVKLSMYKNSDKCYICGNGPSLNKVDFSEIQGDTIVMNDFWKVADAKGFKPTFYLINDSSYNQTNFSDRFDGVIKCFPDIPHILTLYLGPIVKSKYENTNCNIFFFNNIGRTFNQKRGIDFTKCTYYTWNVVSAAIQLAIWLKYKDIYLLGCDYSLFASRFISHVYDNNGEKVPCPYKLRDMLFKYSITTHIHYEIAEFAKTQGVKIVNLTTATVLDAYEIDPNSKY